MEHEEAIRSQAAERYVAQELAPPDRDAFEEHFFDCPECAEEVRWELIFKANARELLRGLPGVSQKPPGMSIWLRRPLMISLGANAALAAGLAIVLVSSSPTRPRPHLIPAYFAPGPPRGPVERKIYQIPAGAQAFLVHVPLPAEKYASYRYEILSETGKHDFSDTVVPGESSDNEMYLEIPVAGLRGGSYTLEFRGEPGGQLISTSSFQLHSVGR